MKKTGVFYHDICGKEAYSSLEWGIGKNILVEQFLVIKGRNVIGEESTRNTLGHFAEKWKDMF